MDRSQFELLAPGGDIDGIKAAIAAGADAIYCGLDRFNARNRAGNLSLEQLSSVLTLAHQHQCKIFLTLNIAILECEIPALLRLLNHLVNTDIDGVIIQDLGLAYLLKRYFPSLDVHASTQLNTHNIGQMSLLKQLGASRVNLSRELNIDEITTLTHYGAEQAMQVEVFVHGSYCIGFSGLCYLSSERNGASGNRGRCSQPCRDKFQTTAEGSQFPLNLKDNSAFGDLPALANAGVYSLKIEGRIKKPHYVYTTVKNWRQQIDRLLANVPLSDDMRELYTVFNRDFSNGFLRGDIGKSMYIDNPRDNAAAHFIKQENATSEQNITAIKQRLYNEKTTIIETIAAATDAYDIKRAPLLTSEDKKYKAVKIPPLPSPPQSNSPLRLSVLISDPADADLANIEHVETYFQLPMGIKSALPQLLKLFEQHPKLRPCFPAIIIADDFSAATRFLESIRPQQLITNNLGIANLAKDLALNWIAGPQLNITNSYAMQCLAEELDANGAFISNELSYFQVKRIQRPDGFKAFYSIYHPNNLLTSRQCLFQKTSGCKKLTLTKRCLRSCEKISSITNLKQRPYSIQKSKGSHNSIYSDQHVLNLEIVEQLPAVLSDVLIDLSDIETETEVSASKMELISLFLALLSNPNSPKIKQSINSRLSPTRNTQYVKGL